MEHQPVGGLTAYGMLECMVALSFVNIERRYIFAHIVVFFFPVAIVGIKYTRRHTVFGEPFVSGGAISNQRCRVLWLLLHTLVSDTE